MTTNSFSQQLCSYYYDGTTQTIKTISTNSAGNRLQIRFFSSWSDKMFSFQRNEWRNSTLAEHGIDTYQEWIKYKLRTYTNPIKYFGTLSGGTYTATALERAHEDYIYHSRQPPKDQFIVIIFTDGRD